MLAILIGMMVLAVFSQIICRSFLGTSLPWSEEFARYCMIWFAFFGVSVGLRENTHIGFDAIVNILPKKIRFYIVLLAKLVIAALCVVFFFLSLQLTISLFSTGQKAPTLQMPIAFVYMVMPLGFILSVIQCALQIASHINKRRTSSTHGGIDADGGV